ncbi:hypothetical protein PIB30_024876 [Stylosanthes scabra]|uniref:Uncharacterized protein n=1 Tax=Stylosanthes scabra TaxID=79078 RepID=A0ABU6RA40_9FABA|nr:hypothetical protein [Stylosanthes scabra]
MHCKLLEFTMANMRRRASSLHVLFACLLLAASLLNNHFAVEAHQVAHARSVEAEKHGGQPNATTFCTCHAFMEGRNAESEESVRAQSHRKSASGIIKTKTKTKTMINTIINNLSFLEGEII